jgi:prepilin-type N-terminal cleavage/methylation domain-containing protein
VKLDLRPFFKDDIALNLKNSLMWEFFGILRLGFGLWVWKREKYIYILVSRPMIQLPFHFLCMSVIPQHNSQKSKAGFTLLETIIAVAIFAIFAVGIYSGIQFVFKLVYNSRVRIIETSILNEQIEGIRNISFYDVGIVNGSPAGLLERVVTTTRNGIVFEITRTIRNIDDPFDGVIDPEGEGQGGGECQEPKVEVCHSDNTLCVSSKAVKGHLNHGDTEGACGGLPGFDNQPADYKFVDVSVVCLSCRQQAPVAMSTYVSPKFLEGDPTHGALFIEVFDANAAAVQGALVTLVADSTEPTYNFSDTTDNDGMIRIVDLAAGTEAFSITVTKDGYTSEQTIIPSGGNPNPVKLPATVLAQNVSEISFSIDMVASMSVETLDESCVALGSIPLSLTGGKLIGTSPDVLLTDVSFSTEGSGNYSLVNLVWDTYTFSTSEYDIIGSIPNETINIMPGVSQPVQLILGTASTNALRIDAVDSITGQPIANANVIVTSTGYAEMLVTGVGSRRQTDWSGGSGQTTIGDDTRFFTDDGNVDVLATPGDITLRSFGGDYSVTGWLESSTFDLGLEATYQNIIWEPLSQPADTGSDSATFQIASATSTLPESWSYFGPDGTNSTYYTSANGVISDVHNGDRYMRYKVYLSTASTTFTPTISDVSFTYTNSCTPPGQAYFGNLSSGDYGAVVGASGYATSSASIEVDGYTKQTVSLQTE